MEIQKYQYNINKGKRFLEEKFRQKDGETILGTFLTVWKKYGQLICCDPVSRDEIVEAIKKLNKGKAAGPDLIPPEALNENGNSATDA
ncbi:hypothetical protein RRG08_036127 [Elysia crispata]|uniref:Uncharacterized protein n=1 Tax=Elysia crispata TaxID=231223 RepID=A0AAE0ZK21_9GAST|nr:hypothetical protein RRG08_036127 [Elysia crispata]